MPSLVVLLRTGLRRQHSPVAPIRRPTRQSCNLDTHPLRRACHHHTDPERRRHTLHFHRTCSHPTTLNNRRVWPFASLFEGLECVRYVFHRSNSAQPNASVVAHDYDNFCLECSSLDRFKKRTGCSVSLPIVMIGSGLLSSKHAEI